MLCTHYTILYVKYMISLSCQSPGILAIMQYFLVTSLLSLLWPLVDSRTEFPYVSFRGESLPKHGYVDLSLVGDPEISTSSGDAVQCHTDIPCCSAGEGGILTRNWHFPDGERVPFASDVTADIHSQRTAERVDLRRRKNSLSPSGIYRCNIRVNGDDNIPERERVYVGIYGSGGNAIMGIEWCKWSCAQYFMLISIVNKFTVNEQLQRNGLKRVKLSLRKCSHTL